jgi:hypothetical protein
VGAWQGAHLGLVQLLLLQPAEQARAPPALSSNLGCWCGNRADGVGDLTPWRGLRQVLQQARERCEITCVLSDRVQQLLSNSV